MSTTLQRDLDGFERYRVQTVDTPALFIVLVGLFVVLSISLAAPLACWTRERARRKLLLEQLDRSEYADHCHNHNNTKTIPEDGYPDIDQEDSFRQLDLDMLEHQPQQQHHHHHNQQASVAEESPPPNVADLSIFHNEHLEAMKQIAIERRMGKLLKPTSTPIPQTLRDRILLNKTVGPHDPNNADKLSAVPSVATTSRLHGPVGGSRKKPFKSRMPWSHGRPLPRSALVQRSVLMERQSAASEEGSQSHQSRSRNSWAPGGPPPTGPRAKVVSEAAGLFLDRHGIDGEADFYRQKFLNHRASTGGGGSRVGGGSYSGGNGRRVGRRTPSVGGSDIGSVMPPLNQDALSPQDAADAHDPGRILNPIQYETYRYAKTTTTETMSHSRDISHILSAQFLNILDVVEPDFQCKRLLTLAVPTTIGAMADPLYRIILVAIISHFIDTDSMVAYLLVILFIRLTTEEISGAIADAESNLIQDALAEGGESCLYHAGQTIQLAIFFQVAIGVPVLVMWFFSMEGVVKWLVDSDHIAHIAASYTGVIIVDYIIRGASRSFLLPFHLAGQAQFEWYVDLIATIMTGAAIATVATTNDLSLVAIGWIQVIIGIAKAITKVGYICLRGWLKPYNCGFLKDLACRNTTAVVNFLLQAFPLFLGSLLELGEWEVLVLFVGHLGGAEVTTWAMMGVVWELFAAVTEGLGEAASVRVSFFLIEGMPTEARRLANKVSFLALVLVLGLTSLFLMSGPNIAVVLSKDRTIQHLFTELIGLTGLANVSMTFAQVFWSLAGAQGHFGLASAIILFCRWLIIIPMASVFIFKFNYSLLAVAGSVAVGYAVAALLLGWGVFRCDWEQLALLLREVDDIDGNELSPVGKGYDDEDFDEDDEEDNNEDEEEDEGEDEDDDESGTSEDEDDESSSSDEDRTNGPTVNIRNTNSLV